MLKVDLQILSERNTCGNENITGFEDTRQTALLWTEKLKDIIKNTCYLVNLYFIALYFFDKDFDITYFNDIIVDGWCWRTHIFVTWDLIRRSLMWCCLIRNSGNSELDSVKLESSTASLSLTLSGYYQKLLVHHDI